MGVRRGGAALRCHLFRFKLGLQLAKERISGREKRAFAGRSCGPLRPFGRNSKFRIKMDFPGEFGCMFRFGSQPAEVRKFRYELRASAAGRLRPARSWRTVPNSRPARSRADGPATDRSSPPPGGGCGLLGRIATDFSSRHFHQSLRSCGLRRPFGRKFKIMN